MKKELEIRGHKITIKSWNYGEKQKALRKATTWVKKKPTDEEETLQVDPWVLNDEMLAACLVDWDFQKNGKKLVINIDNIHGIEPPELVEDILTEIQQINGVSELERKKL